MKRENVYELIDGERDYQSYRWPDNNPSRIKDEDKAVAEWIMYMEFCLEKAKKRIYYLDPEAALENIRKVTALGVVCMEHNETKSRTPKPEITVKEN